MERLPGRVEFSVLAMAFAPVAASAGVTEARRCGRRSMARVRDRTILAATKSQHRPLMRRDGCSHNTLPRDGAYPPGRRHPFERNLARPSPAGLFLCRGGLKARWRRSFVEGLRLPSARRSL